MSEQVNFVVNGVQPPSDRWVTRDDVLQIHTWSSLVSIDIAIEIRILNLEGIVKHLDFRHTPNSDRSLASERFSLPPGYILGMNIQEASGGPTRGECFAQVLLRRGATTEGINTHLLAQGYLTDEIGKLGFPGFFQSRACGFDRQRPRLFQLPPLRFPQGRLLSELVS